MKLLTKKCLLMYSKVLSGMIAMLGVTSCSLFRCAQPCMYGVPDPWNPDDTLMSDSLKGVDSLKTDSVKSDSVTTRPPQREVKLMYGVPPVRYQHLVEKDGLEIELKQ